MTAETSSHLIQYWSQSKWFRIAFVASLVWGILRMLFALAYSAGLLPVEWTGPASLPMDLPVYILGGQNFSLRQNIYPEDISNTTFQYPYSPPFAMLSMVLLWLPAQWIALIGTILSIAAYIYTYFLWRKIFQRFSLDQVSEKMAFTIPVGIIFSAFWGDLSFLNIGIVVALAATLLVDAVLKERLVWGTIWLTFIMISKLMWMFPLALPLLLGRRQFFWKLVACTCAAYLTMVGISMVVAGPNYLFHQYIEYFNHLRRISTEFPWRTWAETSIFGYNHSIKQIIIFVLGDKPWVQAFATLIKIALLAPLAIVCVRLLQTRQRFPIATDPPFIFNLTFALYLGAFIWLDIVWEVLLGIVIFSYLLATLEKRWLKILVWAVFLPYALIDIIQLISIGVGGESVIIMKGGFIVTDPSIYVPLIMLVILLFYGLLIKELWNSVAFAKPGKISTSAENLS